MIPLLNTQEYHLAGNTFITARACTCFACIYNIYIFLAAAKTKKTLPGFPWEFAANPHGLLSHKDKY